MQQRGFLARHNYPGRSRQGFEPLKLITADEHRLLIVIQIHHVAHRPGIPAEVDKHQRPRPRDTQRLHLADKLAGIKLQVLGRFHHRDQQEPLRQQCDQA